MYYDIEFSDDEIAKIFSMAAAIEELYNIFPSEKYQDIYKDAKMIRKRIDASRRSSGY